MLHIHPSTFLRQLQLLLLTDYQRHPSLEPWAQMYPSTLKPEGPVLLTQADLHVTVWHVNQNTSHCPAKTLHTPFNLKDDSTSSITNLRGVMSTNYSLVTLLCCISSFYITARLSRSFPSRCWSPEEAFECLKKANMQHNRTCTGF